MQEIKELFLLLQPSTTLSLPQPPEIVHAGANWEQLVHGIQNGKYSTDADILSDMYAGSPHGQEELALLKIALKETLTSLVFRLNGKLEQATDPEEVYAECHQRWLRVRLLSGENARSLALDLAHQLLRIAEKFDLSFLCLDITAFLRLQLCRGHQTAAECHQVYARHQYFRDLYELEFRAEGWYAALIQQLVDTRKKQPKTARLAREYAQQLKPAMKRFKSNKLQLYGYLIQSLEHLAEQDYQKMIPVLQQAVRYFRRRPYQAQAPLQIFYYQQLVAAIQLKDFAGGRKAAQQCMKLTDWGSLNWYKFNELYIALAFHTQHFSQAIQRLTEATALAKFKTLPASMKSNWTLIEAFAIVAHLDSRPTLPSTKTNRCIGVLRRLDDALQEGQPLPASAVLAVAFLIRLQLGQLDTIQAELSRIEAWLAEQEPAVQQQRSYLFLSMLCQLSAAGFEREKSRAAAAPTLTKLKKLPCLVANQTSELELIPYEILWELALNAL